MENVYCVLDKSGSMSVCANEVIEGFNSFVSNQPLETLITTIMFNNTINEIYRYKKACDIKPLDLITYRPTGCTSLLDVIGYTIALASNSTADQNTIVILTDGKDNTSVTYTKQMI